jgi:hypothetical protein
MLCAKEIDLLVTNKGRPEHYTKTQGQQRKILDIFSVREE